MNSMPKYPRRRFTVSRNPRQERLLRLSVANDAPSLVIRFSCLQHIHACQIEGGAEIASIDAAVDDRCASFDAFRPEGHRQFLVAPAPRLHRLLQFQLRLASPLLEGFGFCAFLLRRRRTQGKRAAGLVGALHGAGVGSCQACVVIRVNFDTSNVPLTIRGQVITKETCNVG